MIKLTVVIPTLDPSEKIYEVVENVRKVGFDRVIIVNDGSRTDRAHIFERLENEYGCEILVHEVNRGKGRALKTAMAHFASDPRDDISIITLDDDGQHTAEDSARVALALVEEPDKLVLGVRNFDLPSVPLKSKLGNKLTSFFMKMICSVSVSDTQTGLRAIPLSAIPAFLKVAGERFEYETNMLLETTKQRIEIKEVVIETVYVDNNSQTHFHPIRDSFMIYKQLLAFAGSAIASFVIDYGVFWLSTQLLPIGSDKLLVLASSYIARFFSSIFNFVANKKLVFKNDGATLNTALKYYTLCIVQTGVSAGITALLSNIAAGHMLTVWKLLADASLALFSYRIQRAWVFAEKPACKQDERDNK